MQANQTVGRTKRARLHPPHEEKRGGEEVVGAVLPRRRLYRPREHGAVVHRKQKAYDVCSHSRHYIPDKEAVDHPGRPSKREAAGGRGGALIVMRAWPCHPLLYPTKPAHGATRRVSPKPGRH